jgi:16S rRNA processing protein RimM
VAFVVGKIVNTQGVHGELRLYPTPDDLTRFERLKSLTLRRDEREREYRLLGARPHKRLILVRLEGVDDMNAAEKLIGSEAIVPDELGLPLSENEYYIRDLYDMEVYSDDGKRLGVLTDILFTGANDVYAVKPDNGKDILIPAIKQCVLEVDIAGKKMTVKLLEGLI